MGPLAAPPALDRMRGARIRLSRLRDLDGFMNADPQISEIDSAAIPPRSVISRWDALAKQALVIQPGRALKIIGADRTAARQLRALFVGRGGLPLQVMKRGKEIFIVRLSEKKKAGKNGR